MISLLEMKHLSQSPKSKSYCDHPAYFCASIETFSTIPSMKKKCFVTLYLGKLMAKSLNLDIQRGVTRAKKDMDETQRRSE